MILTYIQKIHVGTETSICKPIKPDPQQSLQKKIDK